MVSDIYIGEDTAWGFLSKVRSRLPHMPMIADQRLRTRTAACKREPSFFLPKPLERESSAARTSPVNLADGHAPPADRR